MITNEVHQKEYNYFKTYYRVILNLMAFIFLWNMKTHILKNVRAAIKVHYFILDMMRQ